MNPFGKQLALRILKTFEERGDVQNLALFSTLLLGKENEIRKSLQERQRQKQRIRAEQVIARERRGRGKSGASEDLMESRSLKYKAKSN